MNLLSSQHFSDFMSVSIKINSEKKFEVEDIVDERKIDYDLNKKLQYKIKWTEYDKTTWELTDSMKDVIALNQYETQKAEWQCHWV